VTGPIRTRPGAPARREPARFDTPAAAGSYRGPQILGTCRSCNLVDRRRGPVTGQEYRCGIAVDAAKAESRRLPRTVSPRRPACQRYQPKPG